MKSEKGITLMSLIIYVIAMVAIVTLVTVITGFFYQNIYTEKSNIDYIKEFSRIEAFFTKESNKSGNSIGNIANSGGQHYVLLGDNTQYTYVSNNKSIYQNKIKIASNVENCIFQKSTVNGKEMLIMSVTINGHNKMLKYTFKS